MASKGKTMSTCDTCMNLNVGKKDFPSDDDSYICPECGQKYKRETNVELTPFHGGTTEMSRWYKVASRQATNINLVTDLTSQFLKACGKKDLTKRHVLAFLQSLGHPQFLSSDIIRCLKLSHEVYVKDVLDEFPVHRQTTASQTSIASLRDKLIQLEIDNVLDPKVSSVYRRCAANLSRVIVDLERLETDRHG